MPLGNLPICEGFMACILFVDDDPITLNMLTKVVELSGHQAITAVSAEEALRLADNDHPDLIVLDMNMPDMNGLEVLRSLRERDETKEIPAVVLSAGAEVDALDRVKEAGGQDYLHKPLSLKKLLEVIREYAAEEEEAQ